jgi:NAD(P)H dehydrogenase (quinone)
MRTEELASIKTHVFTESMLAEQKDSDWADCFVTICPVWFGMIPGFMKGYFDKLYISGFGYDPDTGRGLQKGKRIYSMFTCGAATPYLDLAKQFECINNLWDNLFGMCGFTDVATKFFQSVPYVTDEIRKRYLEDAKAYLDQIFDKKPGETGQIGFGALLAQQSPHLIGAFNAMQQ